MTDGEWKTLKSNPDYDVFVDTEVAAWVVKIDGVWVARSADNTIRAEFPTRQEARAFLRTMIGARQ